CSKNRRRSVASVGNSPPLYGYDAHRLKAYAIFIESLLQIDMLQPAEIVERVEGLQHLLLWESSERRCYRRALVEVRCHFHQSGCSHHCHV
ncbi:hypothetical protein GBAR_LOCUS26902, partial [Geodia barretti]